MAYRPHVASVFNREFSVLNIKTQYPCELANVQDTCVLCEPFSEGCWGQPQAPISQEFTLRHRPRILWVKIFERTAGLAPKSLFSVVTCCECVRVI